MRCSIRTLRSPLTAEMLARLEPDCEVVQFSSRLTDHDFQAVAELLRTRPDVALRAFGSYDGSISDLEFLRYFPTLRRFRADALFHSLTTLDGLRHLPDDLESLTIGQTKKQLALDGLARFTELRKLYLEGQKKGIEVLSQLRALEDLTLRSITLPDLRLLVPLDRLWSLDLKLGGTKDLHLLPQIGRLRYLELWLVRGLADLEVVSQLTELEVLFLQALKQVTQLPDLSPCVQLRHVHLETMKGLTDLQPLVDAPALQSLGAYDLPQLQPEAFGCLTRSATLVQVRAGLGSTKKNAAVENLLGPLTASWDETLTKPSPVRP